MSKEVVVAGPILIDGVRRNDFLDVHVEMLQDAGIAARLVRFSDIGPENQAACGGHAETEHYFVLVPESQRELALRVNQELSVCRICLKCEAFIKPGLRKCAKCGAADERDPAELHAEYCAMMLNQARETLSAEGYGAIYASLRETLAAHDPLSIGSGSKAQYDYGTTVVFAIPHLENCSTATQVRQVAAEQLGPHFPSADMTSVKLGVLASDWWRLWSEFRKGREDYQVGS